MKSEKEKMLAGELYSASDPDLLQERASVDERLHQYSSLNPSRKEERREILSQLIRFKGNFSISAPFQCDYGYNIEIGDRFYANSGCTILDVGLVRIGDDVMFGPNVQIYAAAHPVDPDERLTGLEYGKPVTIGDNVWVGGGTIICPGVRIGNNVTIGAGSVVCRDLPDNVVAAGNPCKIMKRILPKQA